VLPATGFVVSYSTRYWQLQETAAGASPIKPDVPVAADAEAYFAGRDPVLEAALAYRGEPAAASPAPQ
jgi:hypothetical protein